MTTYKTIEDAIGGTPLVRLVRIPGADNERRGNVILGKLEGNNPAGSVKDRPAISMIRRAEERGEIRPGDTLIEATSGNTGIALAMAAAIRGYRMLLVMPEDLSIERAQTMKAFGAELILTPRSGGMEYARPRRADAARGQGRVLDQFANQDNPRVHFETTGPEIWRDTEGASRTSSARWARPERSPGIALPAAAGQACAADHRRAAGRGLAHPRHPQVARGLPAEDLRCQRRRRDDAT